MFNLTSELLWKLSRQNHGWRTREISRRKAKKHKENNGGGNRETNSEIQKKRGEKGNKGYG